MKYFLYISLVLCFAQCTSTPKASLFEQHPLSIVQGVTTDKETVIGVLAPSDMNLEFFYGELDSEQKSAQSYFKETSPDGFKKIYKFHIQGLKLGVEYVFVSKESESGKVYDQRSFKSLDLKKKNPKIGVASCFDDRQPNMTPIWQEYLNQKTDINFFIGDNSYADKIDQKWGIEANKSQLWRRYAETFERLYFYHSSMLTPTLFLWDDHDYGLNNGGRDFKYKKDALEVFKAFYPLKEIRGVYSFTLGAGSLFKAFNQNFLFIDARYFRSLKNDKVQTQWGRDQEKRVFNQLNIDGKFTWLIQGDQYFGAYHPFESYERDRPESFLKMLSRLKKSRAKVLFVSGDRHLTEIMKIDKKILGYETYELTSSGMHAKVFPGSYIRNPNPNLLSGKSGVYNFTIVKPVVERSGIKLNVVSKGLNGVIHYEKDLKVIF